jgi:hypothetical protein
MHFLKPSMKKFKELNMNNKFFISFALCSTLLLSCSKSGGGGASQGTTITSEPIETEMYGTYQAVFAPINTDVSGHLNGSLTLVREKDDFVADVRFSGGPPGVLHTQTIHIGDRCPTMADDLNQDGFVDGEEAALIHKEILIPLDDDLSSQWMGLGTYPATDEYGYYFWSRSTPFEKMMKDLHEDDINLTDDYVKLGSEKSLTMAGKIVIIRGVPEKTVLPETAKGLGRMENHQALPIACGIIRKMGTAPGEIDKDITNIPVPTGETVGGSSGADDGALFPPTPTTTGETGNYGEDREDDEVITRTNEVNPGH